MAKKKNTVNTVRLVSSEKTGTFYIKIKNVKGNVGAFSKKRGAVAEKAKMKFKKYDPKIRKHVLFVEQKDK